MSINPIIKSNLLAIQDGLKVLQGIEQKHYLFTDRPVFTSSVGAHFRHVIEHYSCFLNPVEQQLSYDSRERDAGLETDLKLSITRLEEIREQFEKMDNSVIGKSYTLKDGISDQILYTNGARELLFLQSHTIHHYALIGAMLKKLNITIEESFGVATSTLVYEGRLNDQVKEDEQICAQ